MVNRVGGFNTDLHIIVKGDNRMKTAALVLSAVFILFVLAGMATPEEIKAELIKSQKEGLQPFAEILNKNPIVAFLSLPLIILYNNLRVAVINLLLGITLFVPFMIIAFNGFIVGLFISYGNYVETAILILPHGIIEIPAIVISGALGLDIGIAALKKYILKKEIHLKEVFVKNISRFKWVVVMLIVAALVESYLTTTLYAIYKVITGGL